MDEPTLQEPDVTRVRNDAAIAIQMLNAVCKECGQEFSFKYYIREKALKAKECIDFILSLTQEAT